MDLSLPLISVFSIFLISFSSLIKAQQPYVRQAFNDCNNSDNSTSVLGYTCNGLNQTCQSYLTFRSKPPYNTVSSISNLLNVNPSQLSQLNSVPDNASFGMDQLVLVPVNCSCSGEYYQSNTTFVIENETYLLIANDTLQGLSTCQALQNQNSIPAQNLIPGTRLNVPLRCACPTKTQVDLGFNYLLSFLVTWRMSVSEISTMFGVDMVRTLEANGLSEQDPTIYPFTTLLVPLQNPPSISQIRFPPPAQPSTPPPTTLVPSSKKSSSKTWVYIVAGVLGACAIVIITGAILYMLHRKNKKKADQIVSFDSFEAREKQGGKKKNEEDPQYFLDLESVSDIAQSLKVYTFEELQSATENFSPSCLIRGSVYRGKIKGDFAAIKKVDGDVSKEINLLNKINHFNLIRLSGVCLNGGHWYLVYEYAINGPLSDWIYSSNSEHKFLNWTQRMQIALDVATGLNYLHGYTSPPCVHKDLKSSNVLLDSDLRAKITNFGLARSTEGQFALTRHIVGTKGYMAPEYLENGFISPKLDVYAFGIFLLELLSGKKVSVLYEGVVDLNLAEILNGVLNEEDGKENLSNFIDHSLQGNYPAELALFVVRVVDRCIKKDPSGRPGMDEIVQSLSNIMTSSRSWELSNSVSGYPSFS